MSCRGHAEERQVRGVEWRRSPDGNPVMEGAAVWIDCVTEQIHDGRDHDIVGGRVVDLDFGSPGQPLLFFRGGYGSFSPSSLAAGNSDPLAHLGLIDLTRPEMESLAAELEIEVTGIALEGDADQRGRPWHVTGGAARSVLLRTSGLQPAGWPR